MRIVGKTENVVFQAGKVKLYSDFDSTYCPIRQFSLDQKPTSKPYMESYCSRMKDLFEKTKADMDFHITTGRTFAEYKVFSELLQKHGIALPYPKTLIIKNGADEFFSKNIQNNEFPFVSDKFNQYKKDTVKKEANWDISEIKKQVQDLAKKHKLKVVEGETEHSFRLFGDYSLFKDGSLNPDEWKKLPLVDEKIQIHEKPIVDFIIGMRNDGNLKANIVFPPDYDYCPKRTKAYNNFVADIERYLKDNKVAYEFDWIEAQSSNKYRKHLNIIPKIDGAPMEKLYDAKLAFREVVKNKDILIVAGDGINDFSMLNPLEYIEKEEWEAFRAKSKNKEFFDLKMSDKLKYLKKAFSESNPEMKNDLNACGLLQKIQEMPLYAVVVKKEDSPLTILSDVFRDSGKVIEIENGTLDGAVKKIINDHARKDKSFKKAMSREFKNFIFGKTVRNAIIIAVSAILSFSVLALALFKKRQNENTVQSYK